MYNKINLSGVGQVYDETLVLSNVQAGQSAVILQTFPDNALVPSNHRNKPKFMKFLDMILQPLIDILGCLSSFDMSFSVENAVGNHLDIIGEYVGIKRKLPYPVSIKQEDGTQEPEYVTLDDDLYRTVIRGKIAENYWDGTMQNLQQIVAGVYPQYGIYFTDNFDCSFGAIVTTEELSPIEQALISQGIIFPRPAGIKLTVSFAVSNINNAVIDLSYSGALSTGQDYITQKQTWEDKANG